MPVNHFHDHYEIYYLLSGKRYYFIQDRSYLMQEGDLVFIDKNKLHKTLDANTLPHERILLSFNDAWVIAMGHDYQAVYSLLFGKGRSSSRYQVANRTLIENLLFSLLREQQQAQRGWELNSKALLTQLLIFCTRSLIS